MNSASRNLQTMDRPRHSQATRRPTTSATSPRTLYLILYNGISAALWAVVLGRVAGVSARLGYQHVFPAVAQWVTWTQTLAVLEILHSLIGVVRAPLITTAMQVASRLLLVWGIAYPFPSHVASSVAFSTMLLAWSTTEVVRYSFFAIQLATGTVPALLLWLRYNTFFVLYPLGIASECWLVWTCAAPAARYGEVWKYALWTVLLIYVPGSYVLFTHMMAQRRRVLRADARRKDQ